MAGVSASLIDSMAPVQTSLPPKLVGTTVQPGGGTFKQALNDATKPKAQIADPKRAAEKPQAKAAAPQADAEAANGTPTQQADPDADPADTQTVDDHSVDSSKAASQPADAKPTDVKNAVLDNLSKVESEDGIAGNAEAEAGDAQLSINLPSPTPTDATALPTSGKDASDGGKKPHASSKVVVAQTPAGVVINPNTPTTPSPEKPYADGPTAPGKISDINQPVLKNATVAGDGSAVDQSTVQAADDAQVVDVAVQQNQTADQPVNKASHASTKHGPNAIDKPLQQNFETQLRTTTPAELKLAVTREKLDSTTDSAVAALTLEDAKPDKDSAAPKAIDPATLTPFSLPDSTAPAPASTAPHGASTPPSTATAADIAAANHEKIVTVVRSDLTPNGGTMKIRLDPPEMGALQVTVKMVNGAMTASFETSNDQATKMLSHSLGQLKTALESTGVSVEKLHVQQSSKNDGGSGAGSDDAKKQQTHSDGGASQREQQRKEMVKRLWAKLGVGQDPLDMVA